MAASYLNLGTAEIRRRAEEAVEGLRRCRVCPWLCDVDRSLPRPQKGEMPKGKRPICKTYRKAWVSSYFPHFGEEDCLRGTRGSGTIFFSWCNLRCVFCQNWDTSQEGAGQAVTPAELAAMMLELQDRGCHNINFVTPEHVVPQVLEALPIAIDKGLRLPIVYNTSGYDSMQSLGHMDGIVDIYMPDFKFWDPTLAKLYTKAMDYPEVVRRVVIEMHRQVGDLRIDGHSGLATRGLLVRHLVMPGYTAGTREIMAFLAGEVSPATYVNIMGQYRPLHRAERHPEIDRPPNAGEMVQAFVAAQKEGITRLDERRPSPRRFFF
jgi:putative pyruvate formate lyase activating enzyme